MSFWRREGAFFARMLELVSAINRTNSKTAFDSERTISDAITDRDVVGKRRPVGKIAIECFRREADAIAKQMVFIRE